MNTVRPFGSLILAIGMGLFLLLGCRRSTTYNYNAIPSPAKTNTITRRTITFTPSNAAERDLNDAVRRLDTAYPYRLTFIQSEPNKPPHEFVVEYAAADRFHTREGDAESIKIGEATFTKAQGRWKKDAPSTGMFSENMGIEMVKIVERIWPSGERREVKSIGKETIDGVPAYSYSFKVDRSIGGEINCKAWIGAADGLPHRLDRIFPNQNKQQVVYEFVDMTVNNPIR